MKKKPYMTPQIEVEELYANCVLLTASSDGRPTVEEDDITYFTDGALDGLGDSFSFGSDESIGASVRNLFGF